ncbi:MAG: RDD family protein [Cyanobacteria bacterium P01_D01_bin.36]
MSLFNRIKIQTPESVELEFVLAGVGGRAVALVVDYVILWGSLIFIGWFLAIMLSQLAQLDGLLFIDVDTLEQWTIAIIMVVIFALYVGYFVGFETAWYGQTPGKRYARIRVIRDDAQPVRVFQTTLRSLLRPVDDILFLGFFCILLGKREKRIGDWLAGTIVVQTDPRTAGKAFDVSEKSKEIAPQLLETMDFDRVTPDNFATIREYLKRRSNLTPSARKELSVKLARTLKENVQLESLPVEMTADTFLEAVYFGYQERKER